MDAETAARAGWLIRARKLVQGAMLQMGASNLTLAAAVLNTETAQPVGYLPGSNGVLDQLFALEKTLVFNIITAMGVTLTAAERQDIDRRPTGSLQAFLAYSRGLQAQDEGRLDDAARLFENARSIDPGFGAASQRAQQAGAAQQASTTHIESSVRNSSEGQAVVAAERGSVASGDSGLNTTLNNMVGDVNPTTTNAVAATVAGALPVQRAPAAEKTGTDQPVPRQGSVRIVVLKP